MALLPRGALTGHSDSRYCSYCSVHPTGLFVPNFHSASHTTADFSPTMLGCCKAARGKFWNMRQRPGQARFKSGHSVVSDFEGRETSDLPFFWASPYSRHDMKSTF